MSDNKPSYYSILTAEVRYSKDLTDFEKLLFSELTALSQKDGYCTAGNQWLADLYDKSAKTISRSISRLEQLGFIEVLILRNEKQEVVCRKIRVLTKTSIPMDKNVNTLWTKTSIPMDKNVKENNTRKNNTSINTPLPPNEAQNKTDDGLQPFASEKSLACENVGLVDKKSEAVAGVPAQEILSAYNEILGDVLPKAQLLNKSRQRAIKARWAEVLNTTDPSGNVRYFDRQTGIEWWKRFFAKVKLNPHWVGANDLGWRADLDWICKPTNFLKVLEWRPVKN